MPAALRQLSALKVEIMILSVFGDESSDETKQRVWAVSGIVGTDGEWEIAKQAWLERTGGKVFHAAECETDYANHPDPTKHKANLDLYRELTQLLVNGPLAGISYALNLVAYRQCFGEGLSDIGYYKCLADVVNQTAILAKKFNDNIPNPDHPEDEAVTLEFTFDNRLESAGNAGSLYSAFINQPEWVNDGAMFGTKISFDCRTNPRIQMADLFARESMKEVDRLLTGVPPKQRRSYQALKDSGKFIFAVRDQEYFDEWKCMRPQIEADTGMTAESYVNWLIETGRVQDGKVHDNFTNRCTYFALLDSRRKRP
jgi:hypothetical protein